MTPSRKNHSITGTLHQAGGLLSMAVAACLLASPAHAQKYPVSGHQRAIAQQVAARGVPVSELNANAPKTYTVQRGDTLWGISGMYLNKPWRWPELWGMNMKSIRNPHLIYPGQVLHLDIRDGYARLGFGPGGATGTLRLSPAVRVEEMAGAPLPTVRRDLIEPFLVRPVIKDLNDVADRPDVVASVDDRLIMGDGDRIYVRGSDSVPLSMREGSPKLFSVFRKPRELVDPETGEVLGYEGEYVAQVRIVRDEFFEEGVDKKGRPIEEYRPATMEVLKVVSEVRIGDRLDVIQEDTNYGNFVPRVPPADIQGRVVSLYADQAVNHAASGQVVAINLGRSDAIEVGHVMQILRKGRLARDPENGPGARVRLPDEPNGVLLIFRVFDRVSYGLIMDSHDPVSVGDKLVAPE